MESFVWSGSRRSWLVFMMRNEKVPHDFWGHWNGLTYMKLIRTTILYTHIQSRSVYEARSSITQSTGY